MTGKRRSVLGLTVIAQDAGQARLAREALLGFGKGRHTGALNLGDRAASALARLRVLPLLFKGEDFARTNLLPAACPSCPPAFCKRHDQP